MVNGHWNTVIHLFGFAAETAFTIGYGCIELHQPMQVLLCVSVSEYAEQSW